MARTKTILRFARYSDIPHIEKLVYEGIEESATPFPKPEYPHLYMSLSAMIADGAAFVAIRDGKLAGGAIMTTSSWPWAPSQNFYTDAYYFVSKDHRASDAGKKLLDAMVSHAREMGILLVVTNFNGVDLDRKDDFFRRNGGERIGSGFLFKP
jgi:GNAT superfamily N-acetyltransferase